MADGAIALFMFPAIFVILLAGYPVAFALAGAGIAFALLGAALDVGLFQGHDLSILLSIFNRIYGLMDSTNEVLIAVPLFTFMGVMLERSEVARELLEGTGRLFGQNPGGLGVAVIIVGALLAASTGIVGATVITMGLISLPVMLKHGYSKQLATGTISASGTLGQIIPPSILLVILGETISYEYIEARRRVGDWAPDPVSVGDLFAGALLPGLLLVTLYLAYQLIIARLKPESCPPIPPAKIGEPAPSLAKLILPPSLLIVATLGSILAGIATPSEAAAVGSIGAILLASRRTAQKQANSTWPEIATTIAIAALIAMNAAFDLRLTRTTITPTDQWAIAAAAILAGLIVTGIVISLTRLMRTSDDSGTAILTSVCRTTLRMNAMVFAIFIGAQFFNLTFRSLGGDHLITDILTNLPGGPWTALAITMAIMFGLGFFLDFLEIIFVMVPVVAPALFAFTAADGQALFHPAWLAVLIAMNLQTSFLTPPFGFALFYLKGVAPPEIRSSHLYQGIVPFVALQILALLALVAFPKLATWLPSLL